MDGLVAVAAQSPPALAYSSNLLMRMPNWPAYGFIQVRLQSSNNAFLACIASASLFLLAVGCSMASLRRSEAASEISGCRDHYNFSSLCRGGAICCAIAMG